MSEELKSEIVLASGQDEARLPDIPRDVLKALHSAVLGKREVLSINRHRRALVDANDLEQLCHILSQWSTPYDPVSRRITIAAVHSTTGKERRKYRYNFSSLDSFKKYDLGLKDPIVSLEFKFSMISRNPETGEYLPIDLSLDFTGLYDHPSYYLKRESAISYRMDPSEISCKISVSYVDHIVSKSIISAVEDWYDALPEGEDIPTARWLRYLRFEYRENAFSGHFIGNWLPIPFAAAIAWGLSQNWELLSEFEPILAFLLLFLALAFLISTFFRALLSINYFPRHFTHGIPLLRINKGNLVQAENFEKYKSMVVRARKLTLGTVVVGFLVNVGAALFVNIWL